MSNTNLTITNEALDDGAIIRVADLYKRVFATPPWNEAFICTNPECGRNYGLAEASPAMPCKKCGAPLREYYDLNELSQEIAEISRRTGFCIASLLSGDRLDGFWYGWEGDLVTVNRQKLQLVPDDLSRLQDITEEDPEKQWFYLAEFGMDPALRGQGRGKELFQFGLDEVPAPRIIARTTPSSPAYYINKQNGFRTVWNYQDGSGRVIMARQTNTNQ